MENCEGRDWQKDWELVESLALYEFEWGFIPDVDGGVVRRALIREHLALRYWLQQVRKLEKANCRLRTVVKVAKLVVDEWILPGTPMMGAPIRQLQDALAELEEKEEG